MKRRASGVLERVANGIAHHRCGVRVAPLAKNLPLIVLESTGLDVLLCVIPCPAGVVQHRGEQDAADRSNDQHAANRLVAEQESNDDWGGHRNHAWRDHLAQCSLGGDVNHTSVVRANLVGHDPWRLAELTSNFNNDRLRRLPYRANCEGAEEVGKHCADECADEDVHVSDVYRIHEWPASALENEVDLVTVCREEEERGERCRGDRVTLGEGLRRVADRV